MFTDEANLKVESGGGGRGCESYRVRADRKRVPDGGDGGRGGDVIFQADQNVSDLDAFRFRSYIRAPTGEAGGANQKTGRSSRPVVVKVPCGTLISNRETGLRIRELDRHGDEVVVARGGEGGTGNRGGRAVRSPKGRTSVDLHLILRLASDAILVGLPNSGKSLLLNRLTRAHAKTEAYPFSTKAPKIGVMTTQDYRQIRLCELPGLLQGSHSGKGMGNKFLRHIAKTKLVVLVLDPFTTFGLTLAESYDVLVDEIRRYDKSLLNIPRLIVVNKIDVDGFKRESKKNQLSVKEQVKYVSAEHGDGIEKLSKELEERTA